MSESYVQTQPDSTGKKLRAIKRTVGANEVYEEVIAVIDTEGNVIDPRSIRALTNSDVVSVEQSDQTKLKATVTQAESGTVLHFSKSATNDLLDPTNGTAAKITGFFMYCDDADTEARLNFKTSDNTIAGIIGKGAVGMNLVGVKKPQGAQDELVEITFEAGSGTVQGWFSYEEV